MAEYTAVKTSGLKFKGEEHKKHKKHKHKHHDKEDADAASLKHGQRTRRTWARGHMVCRHVLDHHLARAPGGQRAD